LTGGLRLSGTQSAGRLVAARSVVRVPGYRSTVQTETRRDAATPGRQRLVWDLLVAALASLSTGAEPVRVLDCGGGSGSFAVPLAEAGATVTVVDVSVDALATLSRRAAEAGVAERVHPVQADVEALGDAVAAASFDLVLAHGILEAVDHVGAAFEAIAATVRPGGLLSVLVGNPVAGVLARALAGDLAGALAELRGLDTDLRAPGPDGVHALCRAAGLLVEQVHGIGVFTELVPGAALDAPGAGEALDALEAECAVRAPFSEIAGRVHTLARRPG
jgi:2-polyprenyl-3-methyl-5-hydroxy-6-metoxy-1,4-benzoquinol methylase